MRAFGEDAESVSRITNVYAYPDHSFLTCSFPVMRTHVYVRRLVEHGLKVGVVSQMEASRMNSYEAELICKILGCSPKDRSSNHLV